MGRVGFSQLLLWVCCLILFVENKHFVNVATGKTYRQISTYFEQGQSSNAANGNTGGLFDGNNCIHTDARGNNSYPVPNNTYHWWEVDLGRTYLVLNITVWARTNYDKRLYPFIITVDGELCVIVTSAPSTGRSNSVQCSTGMYGRVVRLTLTTTKYMLNLCECQIFDCREGFYGLDCSSPCATNCGGGCNRISGYCTLCTVGFWGNHSCENACPANCPSPVCQREHGYCDDELYFADCCQPGYHGDQCTSPCSSLSSRCTQCSQDGTCTACTGHFMAPNCTACRDGVYGTLCNETCSPGCARCDQLSGTCTACDKDLVFPGCTVTKGPAERSWVVPVVSAAVGMVLIIVVILAVMCWCRRSRTNPEENHNRNASSGEPGSTQGNVTADADRPTSSSPAPGEDNTYYKISDTNNDDERTPYMELASFPSEGMTSAKAE